MDRIPMTREGYEKRKARLDRMENIEMVEVAHRIATARDLGDLSENAEYHAAREEQGMLQARIDSLKDELSRAYFVDRNTLSNETVVFGMRVKVKDLDGGDEEYFELVGPGDEDYDKNKILINSPIGQGLLGKKKGEVAEIKVPMGKLHSRSWISACRKSRAVGRPSQAVQTVLWTAWEGRPTKQNA